MELRTVSILANHLDRSLLFIAQRPQKLHPQDTGATGETQGGSVVEAAHSLNFGE